MTIPDRIFIPADEAEDCADKVKPNEIEYIRVDLYDMVVKELAEIHVSAAVAISKHAALFADCEGR